MSEVCNERYYESYVQGEKVYYENYTCERPKDHEGRHKQKIAGSDPPATFSWPSDPYAPPMIRMDHDL